MAEKVSIGPDAPLLAWGDSRHALRRRRRRLAAGAGGVTLLAAALLATMIAQPLPLLVWNDSASAPIGLYSIHRNAPIAVGDFALARLPWSVRRLAAERRYLPSNVPLVKKVAGSAGDRVCAQRLRISIDGKLVTRRRTHDRLGRPLPAWSGCFVLKERQLFLLNGHNPDSFDGRYFGVTSTGDILGKADLLWVR